MGAIIRPINRLHCVQRSMAAPITQDLTQLLRSWSEGDKSALDQLVPLVHAELHRLARGYMRGERQDHTLQTTASG